MLHRLDLYDRREFCKRLTSAAACTGGLALLPGCSGNGSSSIPGSPLSTMTGSISSGKLTLTITAGSPLDATGGMAIVTSPSGTFLVTRTSTTAFLAVTAQCTHQACVVSNGTGTSYVCPCHGSEFDTSGRVIVGPATVPLQQLQTQFANNVLTIG
jgi:cytochrome b6-f complex iron-sulfur subunit